MMMEKMKLQRGLNNLLRCVHICALQVNQSSFSKIYLESDRSWNSFHRLQEFHGLISIMLENMRMMSLKG